MQLAMSKEHVTIRMRQHGSHVSRACLPTCVRSVSCMSHTHRVALLYLIITVRREMYPFASKTHETSDAGGNARPTIPLVKIRDSSNQCIRTLVKFRSHIEHLRKTIPRTSKLESRSQASRPTVRVVLHGLEVGVGFIHFEPWIGISIRLAVFLTIQRCTQNITQSCYDVTRISVRSPVSMSKQQRRVEGEARQ